MADRPDNALPPPETPSARAGGGGDAPMSQGAAEAAMAAVGDGLDVGDGGETVERVTPPMEPRPDETATPLGEARRVEAWAALFAAVAGLALLRLAWVVWLNPFSLAADEAQYWDWSQHWALTYTTKGPGIAWVIGAAAWAVGLLGGGLAEWVVRLGSVVSWGVLIGGVAWLAGQRGGGATGGVDAGWIGLWLAVLTPVLWAMGQFATIDMPMLACWVVAMVGVWAGLRGALREGEPTAAWRALLGWAVFGAAVGCGLLLKHTALLLIPGVLIAVVWSAGRLRWTSVGRGAAVAAAVLVVIASPMAIGEVTQGWPTVRHLMGHLGVAGGDVAVDDAGAAWGWLDRARSAGVYLGTLLAVAGPGVWWLIVLGLMRGWRSGAEAVYARLLACVGLLPVAMYLGVACVTDTEANWTVAAYPTLLALAARGMPARLAAWRAEVAAWRELPKDERPKRGFVTRRPETPTQNAWHWSLVYGLTAIVGLSVGGWLLRVPMVGELLPGVGRVMAHGAAAERIDAQVGELAGDGAAATRPIVIASQYGDTALLAFYLDGRPTVYCGQAALAGRRSAYDALPGTDLDDASLHGRDALLFGASAKRWGDVLIAESVEAIDPATVWGDEADAGLSHLWGTPVFVARGYGGLSELGRQNREGHR
ncbi:MAG: glycosyltransferase family 39 protein [Planctomycetota bacterium]